MKIPGLKVIVVASVIGLGLTSCSAQYDKRVEAQKSSQITNSLEKQNLERKRAKEEDPNKTRYLYLWTYGQPVGYYVTRGKVSSNASQIGPEQEVLRELSGNPVVDSAKDDGTYGPGDPGLFFFTADGIMIETNFDYQLSDVPLPIQNMPRLLK